MIDENTQEAGEILENILLQPLSIPGSKPNVSLLDAANRFVESEAMTSDFRKILLNFLQYPEQTRTLLRELEILQDEL